MTGTGTSSSPKSRRGFTLIEVMVALAVVAFAFVGLIGLHGRNIQLVDRANHYSRATLLAREMLAQLQFEDPANLSSASGVFESHPEFRWEREVEGTSFATVKLVLIRVLWDGGAPIELVYFVGAPDE